ncbi:cutinase transcription factor 1 beta [Cordyceps fumosorosea ARSEF 2679]|uniref:Cutinase transcription factor 1 beta n=1 Tax=Cordyceps fumosorosea (strain ARSEF 2679) TaxID=1081104 RepID=A0A168DDP5_CORFA|nr:cutinase transcription factor 1 beta [Cordyceps fumosorosea ARSEF 2679]OAA72481.1 cutinase transcription factor 1 beta [Cordyceps fumosorosea ARSEF 2679]
MAPTTDNSSVGSHSPSPPPLTKTESNSVKKRSSADGGVVKVTKRRAARACVSCRARKVRCDVVEGAPCGNCRWDNVECIVQESRRRKKSTLTANAVGQNNQAEAQIRCKTTAATTTTTNNATTNDTGYVNATDGIALAHMTSNDPRRQSTASAFSSATTNSGIDSQLGGLMPNCVVDSHIPHLIYQRSGFRPDLLSQASIDPNQASPTSSSLWAGDSNTVNPNRLFGDSGIAPATPNFASPLDQFQFHAAARATPQLPPFLRPLPSKITPEDVSYLQMKGALTLPALPLQNALLQAYVEYIHPFMPLMDLHPFLSIVNNRNGFNGQMSLLLYHAVLFAATASVDMKRLREAGYTSRKAARKAFFQKTRLLYDFDYESDRLVLVQSLLLMTYWYETPDDQKDTWHWMGVAISLAHTIGLHRKPGANSMSNAKRKLWKRIWWSCFMRDRLIALGMRRPTRIKDEDFDVPMLAESDFEIQALAENNTLLPADCVVIRDVAMQRELATLCISKAKLCLGISHMLKTQYSVLIRDNMKPENTTNSTMMLFPNKFENGDAVDTIDAELRAWADTLPECCRYRPLKEADIEGGRSTVTVHRTLLHMVHQTTISALHRPQFLPSSPTQMPTTSRQVQDMSRVKVRDSAMQITRMVTELHDFRLEKYLPTTGVTVILPAMIIHLLEMKGSSKEARERATIGFRQCMRVMEKLREIYSAADYATGFLDAALRKADISVGSGNGGSSSSAASAALANQINQISQMGQINQNATSNMLPNGLPFGLVHTPPPEGQATASLQEALFGKTAMLPPNTVNAAALELTDSPPQTDFDATGLTPSASGLSEELPTESDPMDMDFMEGHDEFDWNAVAGTDFDVDQFLQFPTDGAKPSEEMMSGVFGGSNTGGSMEDVKMGIEASA